MPGFDDWLHAYKRVHTRTILLELTAASQVNKVVLAYSGGLDTSVILKWLQETYECEVVTFTADLGQVSACEDV